MIYDCFRRYLYYETYRKSLKFIYMKNITKFLTLSLFLLASKGTNVLFAQNSLQAFAQAPIESAPLSGASKDWQQKKLPIFALKDLQGNLISTENLKGKIVHINFWSTACKPCIAEFAEMNELKAKYDAQKSVQEVVFLAIAPEDEATIQKVVAKFPLNYTVIPNATAYLKELEIDIYPTNFFVDKEGIIKEVLVGSMMRKDAVTGENVSINLPRYDAALQNIMKGKPIKKQATLGNEILQTPQKASIINTIEPNNILINQVLTLVVGAINGKNISDLLPYLLPETKAANISGTMLQPVLKQVFIQYPSPIETVNITKIQAEDMYTRVEGTFKLVDGTEKQHNFLINETGKFLEINILKSASIVKTDEDLSTDSQNTMPAILSSPFEVKKNLIFVEATINGRKGKFIVDSGSPVLLLNKQYFDDLAKGENNKVLGGISGAGGQIVGTSYAAANEFLWQNMTLKDVKCLAIDLAHLEKVYKCEILGLIGYNILTHYQTTYNYQDNVLTLHKAGAENLPKPTGKLLYQGDFEMAAHLAVVKATIGNQTLKFGIDCGASTALIGTSQYQTIKEYTKEKGTDDLKGADQKVKTVPVIKIKELKIGEITFKNMKAAVADVGNLNQGTGKKIDGLLGYDFLKKYKTVINYKTKQISFYE